VAGGFEVGQESADGGGVQVGQVQLAGQFAGLGVNVTEQQPERVTVGRDRVRGGGTLNHQPVGEERLQDGRESCH